MPAVDAPLIQIIVASTRDGRRGGRVGAWFDAIACAREDIRCELIDLLDWDLPWYRDAVVPPRGEYSAGATLRWAEKVAAGDGYVLVTPEYNHGYPAPLKQAIDLAGVEWRAKPVGFVSYGGRSGGLRAVEQLRQVFAEVHATTVRDCVSFHEPWARFDADGEPHEPDAPAAAAAVLLGQLAWWADALRSARTARPYAA